MINFGHLISRDQGTKWELSRVCSAEYGCLGPLLISVLEVRKGLVPTVLMQLPAWDPSYRCLSVHPTWCTRDVCPAFCALEPGYEHCHHLNTGHCYLVRNSLVLWDVEKCLWKGLMFFPDGSGRGKEKTFEFFKGKEFPLCYENCAASQEMFIVVSVCDQMKWLELGH